ncbi:MAG: TonB-dependent receptor, partial [Acidobacteriota bacterium]
NNITAVVPAAFSNYNSLQVKFEHRGDWVTLLNSFTYSKAIDTVGQVLEGSVGGSPNPQDIRNVANDKGASSFDQRWNNATSFVLDVPYGKGRRFGASLPAALDAIVGGWQTSAIINSQSGLPLNLRYPDAAGILSDGQPDFLGNVALRPNVIDGSIGVLAPEGQRSFTNYFNRANLAVPPVTNPFG